MTIKEEKSKKPLFQRIREKVLEKWKSFSDKTQTLIGIGVIILLGAIACSPILVFSSFNFLSSIAIFYKILVFLVFGVLFLFYFFKWTFNNVTVLSKTLKTFYGWEDGIAVLLLIYGIFCFWMQPTVSFLVEFRAELIGAGIATLLIGNASQAAQIQEEKKRLILQMGSPDHSFAIEAVRQLRQQGWIEDGSLKGADLAGVDLSGVGLGQANMSGATLIGANFSLAKFFKANLSGANFYEANLSRANFYRANLSGADLVGADLSGADVRWANLSGADFLDADLIRAELDEANLTGARLGHANLSGAILWGTNLRGAYFYRTDLSWADLVRADLSGANLKEAILSETTNLVDAFYTEGEKGSVFPDGFNPADYGMHLIHEGESYEEAFKRVFPDK